MRAQLLVDSDTWTENEKLFVTTFTRKNTGLGEAKEEERREQNRFFFFCNRHEGHGAASGSAVVWA